ncbi:hypothetical protein [Kitasatospora sp. DSM 101779]|uniref:hypothetical protein n=1 Tax=Kitasatospora sp. DSM 101779 TaxID=2853165 RepID=UPI0021D88059|nr:hypothetical protein [Kitasatospora sp. DSM 101779]MCU7820247.1 hypothetical protein [Kitasatospora sp. DSM 101779]
MAIAAVFEIPGMTQDQYEQSADKVTGGRGPVTSSDDWPVPGLISHTAAPTPDGWLVVDVWESEEAFRRFGEIIVPILQELGVANAHPKIYPVHTVVTR